jgi:hypothetical protein
MRYLVVVALLVSGCSLLNPSKPQSGQATVVVGQIQSMAACIQSVVNNAPKTPTQVHVDAVTTGVTACVNQFEPAITAAALGATAK